MNVQSRIDTPHTRKQDFHAWLEAQGAWLRARDATALDWELLAEEIEGMGGNLWRELKSRMAVVIAHFLKLQLSSATHPRARWVETQGSRMKFLG